MNIIFDCDGVIRSASWEGLHRAYLALCEYEKRDSENFFSNLEGFKKWWDPDWMKNVAALCGSKEAAMRKDIIHSEIFHEVYDPYIHVFHWVERVLTRLTGKHEIALLSSSSMKSLNRSLQEHTQHFSLIVGSENIGADKLKPNPQGVFYILKKLEWGARDTLIIGDMWVDVQAGRNAGLSYTGVVKWGLGEWDALLALEPEFRFEEPEDLLQL